jgi:hypothetical protein
MLLKKMFLVLGVSTTLIASPISHAEEFRGVYRGGYGHYHGGGGAGWIAPLVIGGVAGYVLAQPRQQTVIVQQPQVVQPLPSYVPANGEPIYQYQNIYDANCSCYQRVLVQIN